VTKTSRNSEIVQQLLKRLAIKAILECSEVNSLPVSISLPQANALQSHFWPLYMLSKL
jgi:hypothetical protein